MRTLDSLREFITDIRVWFRPPVSRGQALEIARQECLRKGWDSESIILERGFCHYYAYVNMTVVDADAFMTISMKDGRVTGAETSVDPLDET